MGRDKQQVRTEMDLLVKYRNYMVWDITMKSTCTCIHWYVCFSRMKELINVHVQCTTPTCNTTCYTQYSCNTWFLILFCCLQVKSAQAGTIVQVGEVPISRFGISCRR